MSIDAIIVLIVILIGITLFISDVLSVDLVALIIITLLVLTRVISPQEGVSGFSNPATLTVMFLFVLSSAMLKTGALNVLGPLIAKLFQKSYALGIITMMLSIGLISAFINNTPVVAVFIPIIINAAHTSGISPSRLLIPLSYASIFGGVCSLIGTSTTILVSGIAEKNGLPAIHMFQLTPLGIIFLLVGTLYMLVFGRKLLPDKPFQDDLEKKFGMHDYLTELQIEPGSRMVNKKIMDSELVKELEMDIIEVRRNGSKFYLPPGDFILLPNDLLKVRCNVQKIRALKDKVNINVEPAIKISDEDFRSKNTTLVELIITSNSAIEGKTLKQLDFRRTYRSIPLAIRHRDEIRHENLHEVPLRSGDVVLAEVKTFFLKNLKEMETSLESPFIILSEQQITEFKKQKFAIVLSVIAGVILLATLHVVPVMIGAIAGTVLLVLLKCIKMKDVYKAIDWKIVFLLAGSLSLGVAMKNSGLADYLAHVIITHLGRFGPIAILSGIYLLTSVLTEIMSNNATAALITPIAIVTANTLDLSPVPFLMAVTFAASASFMTPIGYQTNTMIFSAGQYKFGDFLRAGTALNILFWLIATLLIPVIYPF